MSPAQSTSYPQAEADEVAAQSAARLLDEPLEIAAWRAVVETFRERLAAHTFRTYILPARVISSAPGALRLGYPTKFLIDMVRDHYRATFEDELLATANRRVTIELEVLPEEAVKPAPAPPPKPAARKGEARAKPVVEPVGPGEPPPSRRNASGLDSKHTLDAFVVGESNRFANAACEAIADAPGKAYNPLFLWGGVGLGKTHLMQAVGNKVLERNPKAHVLYCSSEQFTNDLVGAIQNKRMADFRKRYREVDVLLVDDVQFLARKPATEEEFFHTFNALHNLGKQIIVSSDSVPQDIDNLEERLRSRFQWGLIADIQPPELETRMAILQYKARAMRMKLPEDVCQFLAMHVRNNVRELEGALTRVAAFANLMRGPVTVDVCREVLKGLLANRGQRPDIEHIIKRCAECFRVSVGDIKGRVRKKQLARARQVAMYLGRKLTELSFPELGDRFGGKDHTTVMNAVQRVPEIMQEDEEFRLNVESLERELSSAM